MGTIAFLTKQMTATNPSEASSSDTMLKRHFPAQGEHLRPPARVGEQTVVFPRREGREVDDGYLRREIFSVLLDFHQPRKRPAVSREALFHLPQNAHFFDEIHVRHPPAFPRARRPRFPFHYICRTGGIFARFCRICAFFAEKAGRRTFQKGRTIPQSVLWTASSLCTREPGGRGAAPPEKKLHKMKNIRFLRGGRLTCGHFSRIIVNMKSGQETKGTNRALRVLAALLLTALSAAAVWFIFSNSLRDAASSSSQSQTVTEGVQDAIGTIAPSSPVANAEGEDFARLHAFVRKCAHFSRICPARRAAFVDLPQLYPPETVLVRAPLHRLSRGGVRRIHTEFLPRAGHGVYGRPHRYGRSARGDGVCDRLPARRRRYRAAKKEAERPAVTYPLMGRADGSAGFSGLSRMVRMFVRQIPAPCVLRDVSRKNGKTLRSDLFYGEKRRSGNCIDPLQ